MFFSNCSSFDTFWIKSKIHCSHSTYHPLHNGPCESLPHCFNSITIVFTSELCQSNVIQGERLLLRVATLTKFRIRFRFLSLCLFFAFWFQHMHSVPFIFPNSTLREFALIFGADSLQIHSLYILCRKDLIVHIVCYLFLILLLWPVQAFSLIHEESTDSWLDEEDIGEKTPIV